MNNMKNLTILALVALVTAACMDNRPTYDASGTFEAVETIISAEAGGVIRALDVAEGQSLSVGQIMGYIDSTQLTLKKEQLQAQIDAVLSKKPEIAVQVAALQEQLDQAVREEQRIANMAKADAATPKQLDDANARVEVIKKQIAAQRSVLSTTSASLTSEIYPLEIQIAQVEDLLSKCRIVNPMEGTVLVK